MAEDRTLTGGRDDLLFDISRCLRMRFCDSSCRRCVEACPHGAVTLDDGLAVNEEVCQGCLLCTTACPSGALEMNAEFADCLARLAKVPEPVLGCVRTGETAHAALPCLGGLSEEHLLSLSHELTGIVTLNLSPCRDCPNISLAAILKQRLATLTEAGLVSASARIIIAESPADVHYHPESLDRRGFFNSLRSSLFSSAASILAPHNDASDHRSEYAAKRVPARRLLLNEVRERASQELRTKIQKHFDTAIIIDSGCSTCQGCVAICPTGALKTTSQDNIPTYDQLKCTACGLCAEFCLDHAVSLSKY